jgi:hypothetical protein
VTLFRELAARLRVGELPVGRSMPVEAVADQLEAAVREARSALDAADSVLNDPVGMDHDDVLEP